MTIDRPGSPYSEFFGRLRARPLSSWQHPGRVDAARETVAQLAALGWDLEHPGGVAVPSVPDLGSHALADQLEVLTNDAEAAGVDPVQIDGLLARLAEQLSLRLH